MQLVIPSMACQAKNMDKKYEAGEPLCNPTTRDSAVFLTVHTYHIPDAFNLGLDRFKNCSNTPQMMEASTVSRSRMKKATTLKTSSTEGMLSLGLVHS